MNEKTNRTHGALRIAQALIRLSSLPRGSSTTSIALARVGNCELRIFEGTQASSDGVPYIWLELFDHSTNISVDSCSCQEIEQAAAIFEDFISQAARLNEASGPDDTETQG